MEPAKLKVRFKLGLELVSVVLTVLNAPVSDAAANTFSSPVSGAAVVVGAAGVEGAAVFVDDFDPHADATTVKPMTPAVVPV